MIQFSVVIPTCNRPRQLRDCLAALAAQEFPGDQFEVIVVDDGSAPPVEVAPGVVLVRQPNAGPAAARNAGAAVARGRWLAFTDDDCRPASAWLADLAARLEHTPQAMIGGRTVNLRHGDRYAAASQLLVDYLYAYYNADPQQALFLTSNNLALPTTQFQAIGGFDTTLTRAAGEDRDLCDRWQSDGRQMLYTPNALVYHAHELTLRRFWLQHFHYGRAAFYFHQQRARRQQARLKVEPPGFYLRLLRHPFAVARRTEALALAALLAWSQIANACGFFAERLAAGRRRRAAAKSATPCSATYWEKIGTKWLQEQPDKLWRAHSDAVNRAWLAAWWPPRTVDRALKTDMFDELVGDGIYGLLAAHARMVVGMDIALATLSAVRNGVGADVRQLPFADGTFDLVVSNSTLDHFQTEAELLASLRELRRVMRPGGELLLTLDNAANPLVAIRNRLPFALLHRLGLTPYRVGVTCGPWRLRRHLREAGFTVGQMAALLHCPRVLAVRRAAAQPSSDLTRQRRFLARLMKWERLAGWPSRWLTGYFVAVRAIRPGS